MYINNPAAGRSFPSFISVTEDVALFSTHNARAPDMLGRIATNRPDSQHSAHAGVRMGDATTKYGTSDRW
jgi:hypothetical protein